MLVRCFKTGDMCRPTIMYVNIYVDVCTCAWALKKKCAKCMESELSLFYSYVSVEIYARMCSAKSHCYFV